MSSNTELVDHVPKEDLNGLKSSVEEALWEAENSGADPQVIEKHLQEHAEEALNGYNDRPFRSDLGDMPGLVAEGIWDAQNRNVSNETIALFLKFVVEDVRLIEESSGRCISEALTDGGEDRDHNQPRLDEVEETINAQLSVDDPSIITLAGQPIGQCPNCDERFKFDGDTGVARQDPCPSCGFESWTHWGYRTDDGEYVHTGEAPDR